MSDSAQSPEQMLREIDLFQGLSHRHLKQVIDRAREVKHETGREVAAEGLGGSAFHLILSGKVSVSAHGRDLAQLGPGEYFGELSMIDGKPRSATVGVLEPTRTLAIPHQVFEELTVEAPDFTRGLLKTLCARLREALREA